MNSTLPVLQLSECSGFEADSQPFPRSNGPGEYPPGWDPKDPTIPSSRVDLYGFNCHRVHLGSIERGPVQLILDGHDRADVPNSCKFNMTPQWHFAITHLLLVSDKELASALQQEVGIPTAYAKIDSATQETGAVNQVTWTWNTTGQAASKLTIAADTNTQPYQFSDRFFWQRGNGIATLDIVYSTREGPIVTDRPAEGSMQPPMLLAGQPQGAFAGLAVYLPSMSGEGAFRLFSDTLCKNLESSS